MSSKKMETKKKQEDIRGWVNGVHSETFSNTPAETDVPEDPIPKIRHHLLRTHHTSLRSSIPQYLRTESDVKALLKLLTLTYPQYPLDSLRTVIELLLSYESVPELVGKWFGQVEVPRLEAGVKKGSVALGPLENLSLGVGVPLYEKDSAVLEGLAKLVGLVHISAKENTRKDARVVSRVDAKVQKIVKKEDLAKITPTLATIDFLSLFPPTSLSSEQQDKIVTLYTTDVIPSKTPIPSALLTSFTKLLTQGEEKVLQAFDKALLRSPEIALPILGSYLLSSPTTSETKDKNEKLLTSILNQTKSTNARVREGSVEAFKGYLKRYSSASTEGITTEILKPALTSKTSSPEHRATLYILISHVPPSPALIPSAITLLSKETNEGVLETLGRALKAHLSAWLRTPGGDEKKVVDGLSKDITSGKPAVKRVATELVGGAIWDVVSSHSQGDEEAKEKALLSAFIPAFENVVKALSASSNPATGVLEGYVSVALLFKICDPDLLDKNATITSIPSSCGTAKPHFLINDKVYTKFLSTLPPQGESERWLFRALILTLQHFLFTAATSPKGAKSWGKAIAGGVLAVQLATKSHEVREEVVESVKKGWIERGDALGSDKGDEVRGIVRGVLEEYLLKFGVVGPKKEKEDEEKVVEDQDWKALSTFLLSTVNSQSSEENQNTVKNHLIQSLLLSHHPSLLPPSSSGKGKNKSKKNIWVEMCVISSIDPYTLLSSPLPPPPSSPDAPTHSGLERAMQVLHGGTLLDPRTGFGEAAKAALETLLVVARGEVVREVINVVGVDLGQDMIKSVSEEDVEIWLHDPLKEKGNEKPYVDVLALEAAKKDKGPAPKTIKGKDAAMARWDAETRASLKSPSTKSKSSAAPARLTPAQQGLLQDQLSKEAQIRMRVESVSLGLRRGVDWVGVLGTAFASSPALTQEGEGGSVADVLGGSTIRKVLELLVGSVFERTGRGIKLLSSSASRGGSEEEQEKARKRLLDTWLSLSALSSPRLTGAEKWVVGMAVLRTLLFLQSSSLSHREGEKNVLPEESTVEPLPSLVRRTLYKLHFLASQAPLDAYTFGFVWGVLRGCLVGEGLFKIEVGEGGNAGESAEGGEEGDEIRLGLEIVRFHSGEFSSPAYPHLSLTQSLLHILKTSRPNSEEGKEASAILRDLGEAVASLAAASIPEDETEVSQATAGTSEVKEVLELLIESTLIGESWIRGVVLQTIQPFDLTSTAFIPQLWIASHDVDHEQNQLLAKKVWDENGLDVPSEEDEEALELGSGQKGWVEEMIPYLGHEVPYVRAGAALGIAEGLRESWSESGIEKVLGRLEEEYREKAKILAPEFDEYGMVIASTLDRADPFPTRVALGQTFYHLSPAFPSGHITPFFRFLIDDRGLGDRHPDVRKSMLAAATSIIDLWGQDHLGELIGMFESYLQSSSDSKKQSDEGDDHIREAVVILFGRVARHLDPKDDRLPVIVDRLVEALKTPAEQVQIAVSECLSPLSRALPEKVPSLIEGLLISLFDAPKYAERRGAAYGLAGVVKGIGIRSMKTNGILERLRKGAEEKKRYEPRQGTMFAFECLSSTLGRVFEPYIMHILPLLLSSFGDDALDVREAGGDAARVIMGNMSGYGVKLILPTLLEGLEEKQWRSKKGSIELLGMMAYCSPRQLSLSLPVVIPRLTDVITDSHTKVREAANRSLKMFGEVITNPEIQSLVPGLLKALVDPARTGKALGNLLKMSFMHYIDHSSLALIIPIIERGLRERGADVKKKAAQIVGNLASLTDSKDFVPYLNTLLPMVHTVLVDPVPEARATAAKALGTLVERLGEHQFPELVPGLLRTLKTDTSGVDRQGAAQGLSEVLAGLGMERLEGLLPDIITNAQSPRATVREGFMSLLVYLPATFGARFQPHLPKIITPILSGLADSEEYVRDAAMRAGRMVVTNYSTRAIDLLLPELEQGMFDPGWRIRQSSITLVGELLFKVSGISGKTSDLDEEDVGAEQTTGEASKRALVEVLGQERRDRILSALYLVRQDGVAVVRQSSIQIWKALVYNTPKTVRELLPELLTQIVSLISSSEFEQQEIASRTIAELCRKFGEKILAQMIPILLEKSESSDARAREGVCLAICEIMENTMENQREGHENEIINVVRISLVDSEASVRGAAAKAFDTLQEYLGTTAIDQTIPTLLEALRQPGQSSGTALQALKEVMNVRASTVFPVLIPTLTAIPMTVFNAHALASLVSVAGNALSRRLTSVLNPLVKVYETEEDEEVKEAVDEAVRAIMSSIEDAEGLNTLMLTLLGWAKNDSPRRRVSALQFLAIFCELSELDASLYRIDWIRQLISSMEDSEVEVHTEALKTLEVFAKVIPKDEMEPLVVPLRRSIESTGAPGHFVPGFSLPKGVGPLIPIIIAGLTTGSHEQRENAAYAIGDLVERTEDAAIKPFVVPFTGPLIRVATQATTLPPGVKTAILTALSTMLERIPQFVKPFFPQLQRTFVKSASDPSSVVVRNKAAQALGVLMKNQPRVDPVVTELVNGARAQDDKAIATSLVNALTEVIRNASVNISEPVRSSCVELAEEAFGSVHGDSYVQAIAALVSSFSAFPELARSLVEAYLVGGTPPSTLSAQTILVVLQDSDESGSDSLFQELGVLRDVAQKVMESVGSDRPNIARPSREARDILRDMDDPSLGNLVR